MPECGDIFPFKTITVHIDIKTGNSLKALAFSSSMASVQSCSSKGSVFGPGLFTGWQGNRQNQHGFEHSGRVGWLRQNRDSPFLSLLFLSYFSAIWTRAQLIQHQLTQIYRGPSGDIHEDNYKDFPKWNIVCYRVTCGARCNFTAECWHRGVRLSGDRKRLKVQIRFDQNCTDILL